MKVYLFLTVLFFSLSAFAQTPPVPNVGFDIAPLVEARCKCMELTNTNLLDEDEARSCNELVDTLDEISRTVIKFESLVRCQDQSVVFYTKQYYKEEVHDSIPLQLLSDLTYAREDFYKSLEIDQETKEFATSVCKCVDKALEFGLDFLDRDPHCLEVVNRTESIENGLAFQHELTLICLDSLIKLADKEAERIENSDQ